METHVSPDTIIHELMEQNKQMDLQIIVLKAALAQIQANEGQADPVVVVDDK